MYFRVLILIILFLISNQLFAIVQLTDISLLHSKSINKTSLVLSFSDQIKHNVFKLYKPNRVVIDIIRAKISDKMYNKLNKYKKHLSLRFSKLNYLKFRIVLLLPKEKILAPIVNYKNNILIIDFPKHHKKHVFLKKKLIIAIDAGHGGEDPGAIGNGLYEKNITLSISYELNKIINDIKGYHAELIRTGDYFISLHDRLKIAHKKKADLLVSIHANSVDKKAHICGAAVFALSEKIISKNSNKAYFNKIYSSFNIGNNILKNLAKITTLHKKDVEPANFVVLKSFDIPSILIETGFISNSQEAKKLNMINYQKKIATSIANGINEYFNKKRK